MLFSAEFDKGNAIEGYLIPDGFSEQPSIRVLLAGQQLLTMPCNQVRQAVVQAGRHETGLVGFRLDETLLPDIAALSRLEVRDAKTGLLIYRRPQIDQPVQMKLLRLEMQLLPMLKFDAICGRQFQYEISAVERFGHETALQAFHLNAVKSIYISGRLLLRNYEEFLDKGFSAVTLLPDPYYEMASRIFLLKRMAKMPISFIGDRDRIILAPASEHFSEVNLEDVASLRKALKQASPKVRNVLRSPMTRQLVCSYPEQMVTRRDVAPAIDILSRFAVVGHDSNSLHFQRAIAELVGVDADDIPIMPHHMLLQNIADMLRSLPIAELMLEEDLIFDHYVREVVVSVAAEKSVS